MSHKHHPKEARIRAVQQQDGGRPASEICKEMNITPGTLKRWRDQLHLLAPSDAALIREQEKMIEHMARWGSHGLLVQQSVTFGGGGATTLVLEHGRSRHAPPRGALHLGPQRAPQVVGPVTGAGSRPNCTSQRALSDSVARSQIHPLTQPM